MVIRRMSQKGPKPFSFLFSEIYLFPLGCRFDARPLGLRLWKICMVFAPSPTFSASGIPPNRICVPITIAFLSTGRHASPNYIILKATRMRICFRRRISSCLMPRCLDIQAFRRQAHELLLQILLIKITHGFHLPCCGRIVLAFLWSWTC